LQGFIQIGKSQKKKRARRLWNGSMSGKTVRERLMAESI